MQANFNFIGCVCVCVLIRFIALTISVSVRVCVEVGAGCTSQIKCTVQISTKFWNDSLGMLGWVWCQGNSTLCISYDDNRDRNAWCETAWDFGVHAIHTSCLCAHRKWIKMQYATKMEKKGLSKTKHALKSSTTKTEDDWNE